MKKQDITYQDKLNELRLDISHPNNKGIVFVLLEGDSDIRLFRKLFNLQNCKVETIPGGKFKLEECIEKLINTYPLMIGIRDADFVHLSNQAYTKPNLFLTDFHDMEMMLISKDEVFSTLMFEYTFIKQEKHTSVRDEIILYIEQISYLKWLNENEKLELLFESGFQDLVIFLNQPFNFKEYFKRILSKSSKAKITDINQILQKINVLKAISPDPFQICNGHDFMKVFCQYVKQKGDGRIIGDDNICTSFRISFTLSHYKKTKLFNQTESWANSNN